MFSSPSRSPADVSQERAEPTLFAPDWLQVAEPAAKAVPVAVAVAVSQTWFRPGHFIAQGDIAPFIRTSLEPEYMWAWNHDLTGAGSPTFQIIKGFEVLLIRGVGVFGGGEVAAQRVYYAVLFGLVALGGACFARCFTRRPTAVALAGVFAFLNAFVLTQIPNPLVLAAIGLMGIAGSLVVRAAQGERVRPLLLAGVGVGFSYLLINAPLLVVAAIWVVVLAALGTALAGSGGTTRAAALIVRALPWALVLNLWWIVPAVPTFLGGTAPAVVVDTDIRAWSWTHARGSIANVLALNGGWTWSYPEYAPFAAKLDRVWWAWLAFVPPLACFTAPMVAVARQRRHGLVLLTGGLVLVLVGKGLHPPVAGLNLWLYDHVPGFWLLREPIGKVGPALVLVYAALIAIAMSGLLDRLERRRAACSPLWPAALALAAAAVIAFPYPLWNGTLIPDRKPVLPSSHVRMPEGWRAAAASLNSAPLRGKALVLPLTDFYQVPTTWGYYGVDVVPSILLRRPTIQPLPQNYFEQPLGYVNSVKAVEQALVDRNLQTIPGLLRALGVSHVLLRHDLDTDFPGRTFVDPRRIERSLAATPALRRKGSFGVVDVYAVADASSGLVQARDAAVPAGERASAPPRMSWRRHNPTRYSVEVSGSGRPFLLVLAESFDPGWKLSNLPDDVSASHRRVDGYANGWLFDGVGSFDLTIEYSPARRARLALAASSLAAVAALGIVVVRAGLAVVYRRGRPRPRAQVQKGEGSSS